jgi:hypothetical protein
MSGVNWFVGHSPILGATTLSAGFQGCGATEAKQTVQRFVDSFNLGDITQLDRIFAGSETFQWYSTDAPGQRIDPEARDRGKLMAYFQNRYQQHERLKLTAFTFVGNSGTFGNFGFELIRSADDGLSPTTYTGKGTIQCANLPPTLAVWSMARQPLMPIQLVIAVVVACALLLLGVTIALVRRRKRRLVRQRNTFDAGS